MRRRKRFLLDTNVWRYLHDANAQREFFKVLRSDKIEFVIAPSILFESSRSKDIPTRNGIIKLVTDPRLTRLMPEAYSHSEEVFQEMKRLHPEWVLSNSMTPRFKRFQYDWHRRKGGIWDRFRYDTHEESLRLGLNEGDVVEVARQKVEEVREQLVSAKPDFDKLEVSKFTSEVHSDFFPKEFRNKPYAYWRVTGMSDITRRLSMRDMQSDPYVDWLGERIRLNLADFRFLPWIRFWLEEMSEENMPRFWISGAFEVLQPYRRTSDGTPCDTQLSNYLLDADIFVTADKRLAELTRKVRSESHFHIAEPLLIKGGREGVEMLFNELNN